MSITVEFYGIARARAGVSETVATGKNLGEVLSDLEQRFPTLASSCILNGQLRAGFTANIGGSRFVTATDTPLPLDEPLLILSMDAGG